MIRGASIGRRGALSALVVAFVLALAPVAQAHRRASASAKPGTSTTAKPGTSRTGTTQTPGTSTTGTNPAPAPKPPAPKPPARKGSVSLKFSGLYSVSRQAVTIPGRAVTVRGIVRPYVPNQWLQVSASVNGHEFAHQLMYVHRSRGGSYGWFEKRIVSPAVGNVTVVAHHHGTDQQRDFRGSSGFAALDESIHFGSTGRFVELIQQRLARLHFYIPQTGVYDSGTGWAIDAYHRLLHWGTSQSLDRNTVIWLLNGWGEFKIRYPRDGKHAEGNLGLQLLALIDHGRVRAIYPISSGKPSTPTVLGRFRVYRKTPGYLPDGMYYSSFFYTGYAIHGYNPAPDYPASHGCMRVPIQDAISIYNWINFGDGVDVYY